MLTCKHSKFSLPKNVAYLNCAYMSPMLKAVEKAGLRGVRLKRNPAEIDPDDFFSIVETLRAEFARLIGAQDPNRVAIIPSVSYGLATVARNVRITKGQHVLVAAEQFPSNYYPWQSLCNDTGAEVKVVSPEKSFTDRGKIWNERFLEAINTNTRVVAVAHAHWTDGTLFNLKALRQRTREVGALLVIDGTQSVGALPFQIETIQPDALICAGYKWLLGPYSIGLAYYSELFDNGQPIEENWINRLDSEKFTSLVDYESRYQPAARRFSVGEQSNFILAPMALKAIGQINRWGVDNIQEYCKAITEPAIAAMRQKGFLIEDSAYRASHLFGIRHPGKVDPEQLLKKLRAARIYVSMRGSSIRVSPNVYNDAEDLNRLVKTLSSTL